jgi:hypothetical protein
MTSCIKCIHKKIHSFEFIGHLRDNKTRIYYTNPSDNPPEEIIYYLHHFEETKPYPWIWILNCDGVVTKDLLNSKIVKQLTDLSKNTTYETLLHVFVINPSSTIKTLLTILNPFLLKETRNKIHLCSLGLIDTINKLESIGIPGNEIKGITKKLLK